MTETLRQANVANETRRPETPVRLTITRQDSEVSSVTFAVFMTTDEAVSLATLLLRMVAHIDRPGRDSSWWTP